AGERFVAVEARAVVGAAVHQPADLAAAAAIPRAVDLRVKAVSVWDAVLADAAARGGRQRAAVGVDEAAAVLVERMAGAVDRPAEIVDRVTVARAQRLAADVDARDPGRVRAGGGHVSVAAV